MTRIGDRFSINTYSYTQTTTAAECLRKLAAMGARGIELMAFPGHLWIDDSKATLAEIRTILDGEGLELSSLNTANIDLNITGASAEMRDFSVGLVEHFLRIAGEIGAPSFILGPGKANPLFPLRFDLLRDHLFRALDRLLPVAATHGVELWAENMPFAFLPDLSRLLATLDAYGASDMGICYDVANAHFIGEDAAEGIARLGSRLKLFHISDTGRQVYRHDPIGMGDVDFTTIGSALRRAGHDKPPVLEIISLTPDADFLNAEEALRQRGYEP